MAALKVFSKLYLRDGVVISSQNVNSLSVPGNQSLTFNFVSPISNVNNLYIHSLFFNDSNVGQNHYKMYPYSKTTSSAVLYGIFNLNLSQITLMSKYFMEINTTDDVSLSTKIDKYISYDRTLGILRKSSHFGIVSATANKITIYTNVDLSLTQLSIKTRNTIILTDACSITTTNFFTDRIEIIITNQGGTLVDNTQFGFDVYSFE